ncbi:hypothetical protein [Acinetobacter phage vB_AbM_WUPSU]|nr:hypothetical protein [Acinetobacter phage vB_AbM_WUPSU]
MTIEEIRANAPKGATHYMIRRVYGDARYYMRPPYGLVLVYECGRWEISEEWYGNYSPVIKPL